MYAVKICEAIFSNYEFKGVAIAAYITLLTILKIPNALLMKPLSTFAKTYAECDEKVLNLVVYYESRFARIMQQIHIGNTHNNTLVCETKLQTLALLIFYEVQKHYISPYIRKIYNNIDIYNECVYKYNDILELQQKLRELE